MTLSSQEKTIFLWSLLSVFLVSSIAIHPFVNLEEDAARARFAKPCKSCAEARVQTTTKSVRASVTTSITSLAPNAATLHGIPRLTFTGASAPNQFQPANPAYWEGIGMIALPGPIIAILCLCCFPVVLCVRGCCGGCGNSKSTRDNGYTRKEINLTRLAMIILVALAGAGCVLGIIGNSLFSTALGSSFDRVVKVGTNIKAIGKAAKLLTTTTLLNSTIAPSSSIFDSFESTAASVETSAGAIKDVVMNYDTYRLIAMSVAYVTSVAAGAFGILSIILRKGFFSFIMIFVCYFSLFAMWLLFGVNFAIAILLADMCYEIDSSGVTSTLTILLSCPPALTSAANTINSWLNDQMAATDAAIADPEKSSILPALQAQKTKLQKTLTDVGTTLNCDFVKDAFLGLRLDICVGMLNAITLLFAGALIIGIAWFFAMFVAMIGVKRFDRDQKRQVDKFDEMATY